MGAEDHPFLGYNYRISEVNAAIGLAQLRRLDEFLKIQEDHYHFLKSGIKDIPGITFRRVPEGGTENYSFLNFFLPDENTARRAVKLLSEADIDGSFYWYDNNWHYHRKWDHLKNQHSLGPLSQEIINGIKRWQHNDFTSSDHWMSRNISCLIKLSWSSEELKRRRDAMAAVLKSL